jgi:hypothetical protein
MSDPTLDPAEQALLDQAVRGLRDELPDAARLRRLERLVAPVLAAPLTPSPWWRRAPARAALGTAVVVAASSAWLLADRKAPPAAPVVATVVAPAAPPSAAPVAEPTPVVSVEALPSAPSEARRPPPRAEEPADPGDELALLEDARRALATDPAHALALADAHAKRFRKPSLAQERERLAIDALVRLRRPAEAEARARAFEAAYPDSPHLARVRALVAPQVTP